MSSPTSNATKPSTPAEDLTVSPEARKAVKRTKEEILDDLTVDGEAAFSLTHPSLGLSFGDVAGPFDGSETTKDCCNEWSHKPKLQPLGTFKVRVDGARAPAPTKRGRMFKIVCRRPGCKSDIGDLVLPGKRYGIVRRLGAQWADIGKRSVESFNDVSDAMERLIEELDEKHSIRPVGRPHRAEDSTEKEKRGAGVRNPTKPKKGRARTELKRKRGAGGR